MASRTLHVRQAKHNELLINHLDINKTIFHDWVVTITFYAALHYIEADFAQKSHIGHSTSHRERNRLVQREYNLQIYRSYRELYNNSRIARYLWNPVSRTVRQGYKYFSRQDIQVFYNIDLTNIKQSLGFI